MYKVGDKVWVKWGIRGVSKGKIKAKFDNCRYVVKTFMDTSIYFEDELAKRGK